MDVKIKHVRVPIDWDITVEVTADSQGDEAITHVRTDIDGFCQEDQDIHPPAKGYQTTLIQKGTFPGRTKVLVTVTDTTGKQTHWVSTWQS